MASKYGSVGSKKKRKAADDLLTELELALTAAEAMIGTGIDYSGAHGGLPVSEGEVDKFVKDRIFTHVAMRVIPALKRALQKARQIDKPRESENGSGAETQHRGVRKAS